MAQALRRSQFITTYGPGAILEGKKGPRIIPSLAHSKIFDNHDPQEFEIADMRLSKALLDGDSILRIPSNAELSLSENIDVYDTIPFPSWALCTNHQILYIKKFNVGNPKQACPKCALVSSDEKAWERVRNQAIRFVRVCPRGHLDDLDWVGMIQHKKTSCAPAYLVWQGGGSSLRNITIVCPQCNANMNLGYIYNRSWQCSGRFPENKTGRNMCDAEAKILQRGASNLRMTEIYSSLTIPPADTILYRLLDSTAVRSALAFKNVTSKRDMIDILKTLASYKTVGIALISEVSRYDEQDILIVVKQLKGPLPETNKELRQQEFEALQRAAENGSPPQRSKTPGAPPLFEVIRNDIRILAQQRLRITPISRLHVVMVQKGYRRIDPLIGEPVKCKYEDNQKRGWYPGVELYGEGIFIDLDPTALQGDRHFSLRKSQSWFDAWNDPKKYKQRLQEPEDKEYLHPVFIWWHTLSHRLINAFSIDSGYSSAAVRERIYIDIDPITGKASGGILLYTAQPGGDGTLGGMIALIPQFERVLRSAFNTIDGCSNDPLCREVEFGEGKYNGSACYACLLVSETSCEHRNTRLDRNLLKENLP